MFHQQHTNSTEYIPIGLSNNLISQPAASSRPQAIILLGNEDSQNEKDKWAKEFVLKNPHKNFEIIGKSSLMDKLKV